MNRTFFLSCLAFGALNFLGLAIGGMATGPGVASDWYASLEKAPWTPPGWVFGAAWTLVMLGFTVFIARWWAEVKPQGKSATVLRLFALAWVLNVAWNPLFFWRTSGRLGLARNLDLVCGHLGIGSPGMVSSRGGPLGHSSLPDLALRGDLIEWVCGLGQSLNIFALHDRTLHPFAFLVFVVSACCIQPGT